jgi:hypothetical protein
MLFRLSLPDSSILVIWPCSEAHSANFLVIQTHLSRHFHLAVDFLGLHWGVSSSQFIDPPKDFPKQVPGHDDFGQLERDVPAMAANFGPDLD